MNNHQAEQVKLFAVNGTIFGLSFTNIESGMRVFLLMLSIIYTIIMIYKLITKKQDGNK
jgi:hypothetical protein